MSGLFGGGDDSGQEAAAEQQQQLAAQQQQQLDQENAQEESERQTLEQQRIAALRGRTGAVADDDPGVTGVHTPPSNSPSGPGNPWAQQFGNDPDNMVDNLYNQLGEKMQQEGFPWPGSNAQQGAGAPGGPRPAAAGTGAVANPAVAFPTPAQGQAQNLFSKIMGK